MNENDQFIQQLKEKPILALATALLGAVFERKLAPVDIQQFFPGLTKCASSLNEDEASKHLNEMSSDEIESLKRLPFTLVQQQILGMLLMYRDEGKKDELVKNLFTYVEKLQECQIKNITILSELVTTQNDHNQKLQDTITKLSSTVKDLQSSKLPELWSRYFKEIDNGNPRSAVLESLVDLIKFFEEKEKNKEWSEVIERNLPTVLNTLEEVVEKLA